jgi:hypothetical protein
VIPWQDSANLALSPPPQGAASITPTFATAPAAETSWQASTRADPSRDADEPAPSPELATLAPRTPLGSAAQKEVTLRADPTLLGRELQRELARVGCYEGELSGTWTPAARKAMKAFTDRVNATLPVDEPDYILLMLVMAYREKVCGVACPAGEGVSEGRCVPNSIVARRPFQATRIVPPASTSSNVAHTPTPPTPLSALGEGRMGLSGPSAPPNSAPADGQVPAAAAALNPPPQTVAAPAPSAPRRAVVRPTGFSPASFFKQLGF